MKHLIKKALTLKALMLLALLSVGVGQTWAQSDKSSDFTGNVTLSTTGGANASACKVVISGDSYDGIKAGTSKNAGIIVINVPSGTKYLHMHTAGWKGESVKLSVDPDKYSTTKEISLTADDGISNNSPFTFNGDASSEDYYKVIEFSSALTADTELKFTATGGKRFVVWGVTAEEESNPGDTSVKTIVTIDDSNLTNTNLFNGTAAGSLSATICTEDGAPVPNAIVTWTSKDESVATIDANRGVVTLVAAGTTTITASYAGVEDTYKPSSKTYTLTVTNLDPNAKGSINNPYTVAEIIDFIETLNGETSSEVFVKGIVSQVDSYNSRYGSITYWISDDGTTATQFECYSGLGLNNQKFTSIADIRVADEVVVGGTAKKYNEIYEFNYNNYIVSLNRPEAPKHTITLTNTEDVTIYAFNVDDPTTILQSGEEVAEGTTIMVSPSVTKDGYELDILYVRTFEGTDVELTPGEESGTWTFVMPTSDVIIRAAIKEKEAPHPTITADTYSATLDAEIPEGENSITASIKLTIENYDGTLDVDDNIVYCDAEGKIQIPSPYDWITININTDASTGEQYISGHAFKNNTDYEARTAYAKVFVDVDNVKYYSELFSFTQKAPAKPTIAVKTTTVNAKAEGAQGNITVVYTDVPEDWNKTLQFRTFDEYGFDTPADEDEYNWITASMDDDGNISYTISANESTETRTTYARIYGFGEDDMCMSELITFTQKGVKVVPEGNYFVKVTSTDELADGAYLIVYEGDNVNVAFDGSLTELDKAANTIEVTIDEDGIKKDDNNIKSYFEITAIDGGYSIQAASELYIGFSGTKNGLNTSSDALINTIEIDQNANAIITAEGGQTLQYMLSGAGSRFRYYASNQKAIALYKLSTITVDERTKIELVFQNDAAEFTDGKLEMTLGDNPIAVWANATLPGTDISTEIEYSVEQEENVISYTEGQITALAAGTAVITATFPGNNTYKPATATLTVTVINPDEKVDVCTINGISPTSVFINDLGQMISDCKPTEGATSDDFTISIESQNPDILFIEYNADSDEYMYSAKAAGEATVKVIATVAEGVAKFLSVEKEFTVTVNNAPDFIFDFTQIDKENNNANPWNLPVGSSNKTVDAEEYTNNTYPAPVSITVAGSTGEGYYLHADGGYLLFGKQGAFITLPAFDFAVSKIEVVGSSAASTGVKQNIFVGDVAVSTETTGAKDVTNTYEIAEEYQAAGNQYTLKVTSNHNSQVTKIYIYKAETPVLAGDWNKDGILDQNDVLAEVQYILTRGADEAINPIADINGNKEVTISDLTTLIKKKVIILPGPYTVNDPYTLKSSDELVLNTGILKWEDFEQDILAAANLSRTEFEDKYELDASYRGAKQWILNSGSFSEDYVPFGMVDTYTNFPGYVLRWNVYNQEAYSWFKNQTSKTVIIRFTPKSEADKETLSDIYVTLEWMPSDIKATPSVTITDDNKTRMVWFARDSYMDKSGKSDVYAHVGDAFAGNDNNFSFNVNETTYQQDGVIVSSPLDIVKQQLTDTGYGSLSNNVSIIYKFVNDDEKYMEAGSAAKRVAGWYELQAFDNNNNSELKARIKKANNGGAEDTWVWIARINSTNGVITFNKGNTYANDILNYMPHNRVAAGESLTACVQMSISNESMVFAPVSFNNTDMHVKFLRPLNETSSVISVTDADPSTYTHTVSLSDLKITDWRGFDDDRIISSSTSAGAPTTIWAFYGIQSISFNQASPILTNFVRGGDNFTALTEADGFNIEYTGREINGVKPNDFGTITYSNNSNSGFTKNFQTKIPVIITYNYGQIHTYLTVSVKGDVSYSLIHQQISTIDNDKTFDLDKTYEDVTSEAPAGKITVPYNGEINLSDYVKVSDGANSVLTIEELNALGYELKYELVEWSPGANGVNESYFAAIDEDGVTLRPNPQSKSVIGRQPIVKATLCDKSNNNTVVATGYVRVVIGE